MLCPATEAEPLALLTNATVVGQETQTTAVLLTLLRQLLTVRVSDTTMPNSTTNAGYKKVILLDVSLTRFSAPTAWRAVTCNNDEINCNLRDEDCTVGESGIGEVRDIKVVFPTLAGVITQLKQCSYW